MSIPVIDFATREFELMCFVKDKRAINGSCSLAELVAEYGKELVDRMMQNDLINYKVHIPTDLDGIEWTDWGTYVMQPLLPPKAKNEPATNEPVMYAIHWDGWRKPDYDSAFPTIEEAERYMRDYVKDMKGHIVPLYTTPQLNEAVLEAIEYFSKIEGPNYLTAANAHAATLRSCLVEQRSLQAIAIAPPCSKEKV